MDIDQDEQLAESIAKYEKAKEAAKQKPPVKLAPEQIEAMRKRLKSECLNAMVISPPPDQN